MKMDEVEKTYPNWYNPDSDLPRDEQECIWKSLSFTEEKEETKEINANKNDIAYESVSGTYKRQENFEKTLSKNEAITKLKTLGYRTSCKEIASCLEIIFEGWDTITGYWLYIAQHYAVKTINSVISEIVKQHQRGDATIHNPASYFTYLITNFHKKKKKFRDTNGTHKQQEGGANS